MIENVILCPFHKGSMIETPKGVLATCCDNTFFFNEDRILLLDHNLYLYSEVSTRDNQAKGYLKHNKFPTQIARMNNWLGKIPNQLFNHSILDLGCGPGPTTKMLLEKGATKIYSIDFSINSLKINKNSCLNFSVNPIYILQDINELQLKDNSVSILFMADFLQHITDIRKREEFLNNVFNSLSPGGYFFLSFFNINIKNSFKKDIKGSFSNGKIRYERLSYNDVISFFPKDIIVDKVIPMNISNYAILDHILCSLPFAKYLSRMMIIQGRKRK